jgi:capsular exopolysaccharide family
MDEINLGEMFAYFKAKLHILLTIFALIFGLGSFYVFFMQKPKYEATATVIVSSDKSNANLPGEVATNKNLIDTYTQVVKSHRVLDKVKSDMSTELTYSDMLDMIGVSAIKGTEIINITTTDRDAEFATKMTNKIAEHFVKEIAKIYNDRNINVLDSAVTPTEPANIKIVRQEIIAFAAGLIVSVSILFLVFYFDRSVKTSEQVESQLHLPVIGKIHMIDAEKERLKRRQHALALKAKKEAKEDDSAENAENNEEISEEDLSSELILKNNPKSIISEDFRTVRTSLDFSLVGRNNNSLVLTSTAPNEGKSFVSANLAIAFANTGKKVLLVDADMRLGRQHEIFELSNQAGLSNLLVETAGDRLRKYVQKTEIENLSVVTRGVTPPNPAELIDSKQMEKFIATVKSKYDYVIIDSAPVYNLADSLIISKKADRTMIVCRANKTNIDHVKDGLKSLQAIDANIAGVILNQIPLEKRTGYYNQYYL